MLDHTRVKKKYGSNQNSLNIKVQYKCGKIEARTMHKIFILIHSNLSYI